jgi:DNA gyrase subunit A
VIKTAADDRVVAFLCTSKKDQSLTLETQKGRKLELSPGRYEVTGRGGKGREMSKKDKVKNVVRAPVWVPLPAEKAEKEKEK